MKLPRGVKTDINDARTTRVYLGHGAAAGEAAASVHWTSVFVHRHSTCVADSLQVMIVSDLLAVFAQQSVYIPPSFLTSRFRFLLLLT